jgi:hypothetical protein
MKQGFLLHHRNKTSLGPLHDERSNRANTGWVQSRNPHSDPWVDPYKGMNIASNSKNIYNGPSLPHKTSTVPMNALGCYYSQYYHVAHIKMSEYYFSWNDQNPKSNLLRWTSIFLCPIYGEIFISGKWPNNEPASIEAKETPPTITTEGPLRNVDETLNTDSSCTTMTPAFETFQVRWMKTKKAAEHGAAAWAYDCFQYRHSKSAANTGKSFESTTATSLLRVQHKKDISITACIGSEAPYLEDIAIQTVPNFVPEMIRVQIHKQLIEISKDMVKYSNHNGKMENSDMEIEELAWYTPKSST